MKKILFCFVLILSISGISYGISTEKINKINTMKYADIETEYKVLASTTNILKNEALYKLIYEMNETISELRKRLDKVDGLGE